MHPTNRDQEYWNTYTNNNSNLQLSNCGLDNNDLKCIAECLKDNDKKICRIDISNNDLINDDGIQYLIHALRVNTTIGKLILWDIHVIDVRGTAIGSHGMCSLIRVIEETGRDASCLMMNRIWVIHRDAELSNNQQQKPLHPLEWKY